MKGKCGGVNSGNKMKRQIKSMTLIIVIGEMPSQCIVGMGRERGKGRGRWREEGVERKEEKIGE